MKYVPQMWYSYEICSINITGYGIRIFIKYAWSLFEGNSWDGWFCVFENITHWRVGAEHFAHLAGRLLFPLCTVSSTITISTDLLSIVVNVSRKIPHGISTYALKKCYRYPGTEIYYLGSGWNYRDDLMAQSKTAVPPLLTYWCYCSLALKHRSNPQYQNAAPVVIFAQVNYSGQVVNQEDWTRR